MKIYLASSWRNPHQQAVLNQLRDAGHLVYDFRSPSWDKGGFHWSAIDPNWKEWSVAEYIAALDHPLAKMGYLNDMEAMEKADLCVLLMPCGRSAHLELGWFAGKGKACCILHRPSEPVEPELMAKMCHRQFGEIENLIEWLDNECNGLVTMLSLTPELSRNPRQ